MTRDEIQNRIKEMWQVRLTGDAAALQGYLAPGAAFELVGAHAFADRDMVGPGGAASAITRLVADFKFHSIDTLTSVIEGHKAAVTHRATISYRGEKPVTMDFWDFWDFNADGKVTSIRQFGDTDLIRRMIERN